MRVSIISTLLVASILLAPAAYAGPFDAVGSWFDSLVEAIADVFGLEEPTAASDPGPGPDDNCAELGPSVTPHGCG
ncbi:MAG: hypothetical protein AAGN66_06945 [Acidobacteriota bacterium]